MIRITDLIKSHIKCDAWLERNRWRATPSSAPGARPRTGSDSTGDLEAIATARGACNTVAGYAFTLQRSLRIFVQTDEFVAKVQLGGPELRNERKTASPLRLTGQRLLGDYSFKVADYSFFDTWNRSFHSLKTEFLWGKQFDSDDALRQTLHTYLQFYNHTRLHSSLNHTPPATFERRAR